LPRERAAERAAALRRSFSTAAGAAFGNIGFIGMHYRFDARHTPNPYCLPGFSLHDELALLVQAGLTPLQALQAATRNAARFMCREQDLGTIQPGKLADLVLLEANPLDDIANTRRINAVVFGGRLFRKSDLEDMLAIVEVSARN
jgi:predicted amidohydrolase